MSSVYYCNDCYRTYPTPPYLLLREIMGPRPKTLIVRLWLDREKELQAFQEFQTLKNLKEPSTQNNIEIVSIKDRNNKVLMYDATSKKIFAKPLKGENVKYRAIFEIVYYIPMKVLHPEIATTLKIRNTNLYLSCRPEGELIAQENAKFDGKNFEMDDTNKQFFFIRKQKGSYITFESAMYPGHYISTMDVDDMPVTVTNDNRGIQEFVVDVVSTMTNQAMSDTTTSIYDPYDRFCFQAKVYPYLVHSPYSYL